MSGWREQALCRMDPEFWFPPGYVGAAYLLQVEEAKGWCSRCPVLMACRAEAAAMESGVSEEGRNGVWAGMTPQERFLADPVVPAWKKRRRRKEVAV